jgi:peptidoglycan-associated lipoprotein
MKKWHLFIHLFLMAAFAAAFSGCRRSGSYAWEDTKTAGRHMNRDVRSMGGKNGDSRAVRSRDEFYPNYTGSTGCDFIPLEDVETPNNMTMGNLAVQQPRETPGDLGSAIPSIDSFRDPSTHADFASVFKIIFFEYNSSLVKGQQNLDTAQNIANYLNSHPYTYIFIAGHCDERGPEAYNFALGANRANAVRNLLIHNGVHPDQVFTVSYGKERPMVMEHHEEAWSQNRRAEFRVYQK